MGSGTSKAASPAPAPAGGEAKARNGKPRGKSLMRLPSYSCFRGFTPDCDPSSSLPAPPPPPLGVESSKGGATPKLTHIGISDEDASSAPKSNPSEVRTMPLSDTDRDQDDDVLQNVTATRTAVDDDQSPNPSDRPRPCFGVNFGLSRAVSLGSSVACSIMSNGLSSSANPSIGNVDHPSDANIPQQGGASTSGIYSSLDMLRDSVTTQARAAHQARRNLLESEDANLRHSHRRMGPQEPSEGSVRFSRTLSVGRLRDRVLRRTPFSDSLFTSSLYDRPVWTAGNASARQDSSVMQRTNSDRGSEPQPEPSTNSTYNSGSATLREASNRDLLERRSAFLERRRRIRSQVRALQRLGSRFENLSGHERSCILSGQHRTGNCNCRASSRPGNPDEESGTRASISRIVMLAEALFEVLDEIHQQSAALSSRSSLPPIGSVPAPKEIVESLPVKVYRKPLKHQTDEAAQCYICLVEYEEGDCVRILPCNHEFHLTCVDKWLKEIHRVCPLCRGDVCRSDSSSIGKFS
ncbi:hypothetical protein CFC21_007276 [Triticum aestivum]|uniref:RING-type domain-containing protein n=3 Tax=Triticum TaxID=4564 RepID=A0A9R0V8J4_TRITD|nr:E3 ubiquitin-protein ligase RNF6-like [Triticum dicoccoides]XP_044406751.1 E3 ubiquitin-protein ligase RNF6-like [Triticum aestivum]KAF6990017.1 hypothetical protein CFC21_007276 [Triticum aestivum]VAH18779.1 unnamed protein product [Triticum turgidum subsp. durum]